MLSPVAIATWISFCIPWAEPRLAAALVEAGSGGEPFVITAATGAPFTATTFAEAVHYVRQFKPEGEIYLGLAQVPLSALKRMGLGPEHALDKCGSLEIGYTLLLDAYVLAWKTEKSPWKTVSVAYSIYRNGQKTIDTPFGKKATDFLMKATHVAPAAFDNPLRHGIVAEWSAGVVSRQNAQNPNGKLSTLSEAEAVARWARARY
jgi:hypothetical protein